MIIKRDIYHSLIFLTLVSFGFFGSLSHLFSLGLVILAVISYLSSKKKNEFNLRAVALYFALSGSFFIFFFTGIIRNDYGEVLNSLSPMLPIPLIGILIALHKKNTNLGLKSKHVAKFSQISVACSLAVYLVLLISSEPGSFYYNLHTPRLMLFSGNPIPFSFALMGVSFFCLANWKNSNNKSKLIAFALFAVGIYLTGYLSSTRVTTISFLLIFPILLIFLFDRLFLIVIVISILALVFILLNNLGTMKNIENVYFDHIQYGIKTLYSLNTNSGSVGQRLDMWFAAIKSISDASLFGYGITERFSALKPYLHNRNIQYSHPHNDIFAGLIASGVAGGIAAFVSIISTFLASLFASNRSREKVLLGLMLSIPTLITASASTVLFNDISSAWLVFSTYLIWTTDLEKHHS